MQDGEEDQVNSCLTGFDMDPSVQFLGIDWERVSGRCFSLSMHANILESVLLEDSSSSREEVDLVLINKMLRDLAAIEADVLSHSEAVLRGRLSKSQRQLILDEQVKYASISSSSNQQQQVSKSRSFRDTSGKSRPSQRAYRKNKTTHLDKLTTSMSAHTIRCSNSSDEDDHHPVQVLDKKPTVVSIRRKSSAASSSASQGFMQNVTSMFKNIRWFSIKSPVTLLSPPATYEPPRIVSFRRLPDGNNIFRHLRRQNTSQQLIPPDQGLLLPGLIWWWYVVGWIYTIHIYLPIYYIVLCPFGSQ